MFYYWVLASGGIDALWFVDRTMDGLVDIIFRSKRVYWIPGGLREAFRFNSPPERAGRAC